MSLTPVLALALSLAAAQTGNPEVTAIRPCYGPLGPSRPDWKLLPGDILFIAFDVLGLQPDASGRLRFATFLEVEDAKGKSLSRQDLGERVVPVAPVGGRVRHSFTLTTGLDQAPDRYKLKVTVLDVNAKKETAFSREFTLTQPEFGLIRYQLSYDRFAQLPAPSVGAVGQTVYLHTVLVGFKPDPKNDNNAAVSLEMMILDERDRPTLTKPLATELKDVPSQTTFIPLRFEFNVPAAGQLKIVLKATDQTTRKSVTLTVPFMAGETK
jgi:hypothetical protein